MTPEALESLRALLKGQRLLALAVLVDGEPAVGLLPFVVAPDYLALLVRASGLARHSRGLQPDAPFDVLIHEPDAPGADPLQVPRVTLRGRVVLLDPASAEYAADESRYLQAFPEAAATANLGDFRSYRLEIQKGRLVTGFAGAVNLGRHHLEDLAQTEAAAARRH